MTTNYQRVLDAELAKLAAAKARPLLLLHACCAPCSSYTLEYLAAYFDITVLFYNPNIAPAAEYDFRAAELARYIAEAPCGAGVKLRVEPYDPTPFFGMARGLGLARGRGTLQEVLPPAPCRNRAHCRCGGF